MTRRKVVIASLLLIICIIIRIYSLNAMRVEMGYSTHFFLRISTALRSSFGFIPFSIGDILFGIIGAWVLWKLSRLFIFLFSGPKNSVVFASIKKLSYQLFITACYIYIVFNILWGINYNRKGIAWQLGLNLKEYSTQELKQLNCLLIDKINTCKLVLIKNKILYPSNAELFKMLDASYKNAAVLYPFLKYDPVSFKSSMWGEFGNYAGFTGYYNPVTGEAQLNTTIPKFLQPFTACHEVAHQLGYAKEREANFIGYLAAVASADTLFHYSVYLDLFSYANRNLYNNDSLSARLYKKELLPSVKADIREWVAFNRKHVGKIEPFIRWLYGIYLQNNQQPNGMNSYDEVTGFLLAYYKKFGKI